MRCCVKCITRGREQTGNEAFIRLMEEFGCDAERKEIMREDDRFASPEKELT